MAIIRDNHYVPRLYLKSWEKNERINIYKLIVPNSKVPIWASKPSKSIAFQRDLYTRIEQGEELDDFEQDFSQRFEMPVKPCLDKIINDEKLTASEWTTITDYVTAQFVRTPSFLLYINEYARKILPDTLDELLGKISRGIPLSSAPQKISEKKIIPTDIKIHPKTSENDNNILEVNVVNGKGVWLSIVDSFLADGSNIRRRFRDMNWCIISSRKDCLWPTTDNPVAIYNKQTGHLGIENGIAGKPIQIIFPLSPNKVLLSSYHRDYGWRHNADYKLSMLIKQIIINNALVYVYSSLKDESIVQIRPRVVDEDSYKELINNSSEQYKKYREEEAIYL